MRFIFAIMLAMLSGCVAPQPTPTKGGTTARESTVIIREIAGAVATDVPQTKPQMERVRSETIKVDASLTALEVENTGLRERVRVEQDSARKKLLGYNASLFAVGVAGLAISVIVGLWFQTRRAVYAAVGFGVLVAVTLAVASLALWLAWLGFGLVAVAALGLGYWVWRDHRLGNEADNQAALPRDHRQSAGT